MQENNESRLSRSCQRSFPLPSQKDERSSSKKKKKKKKKKKRTEQDNVRSSVNPITTLLSPPHASASRGVIEKKGIDLMSGLIVFGVSVSSCVT